MGASVVQAQIATGAGSGSLADAETGIIYGRDDNQNSTATIPIPTATGTHFSYLKYLGLVVTTVGTTNISNRRVALNASLATGLNHFFQAITTYTQNNGTQGTAAGNYPADSGSNGAVPTGFTQTTTSNQVYDSTSTATSSTGLNGKYCMCVVGVDNTYTAGGNANTSIASLLLVYDEA